MCLRYYNVCKTRNSELITKKSERIEKIGGFKKKRIFPRLRIVGVLSFFLHSVQFVLSGAFFRP